MVSVSKYRFCDDLTDGYSMAKAFQEGDNYKLTQRRRLTRLQPTLQACRPSLFRIVIVMKSVRHT